MLISWDKAAILAGGVAGLFQSFIGLVLIIAAIEGNWSGSWGYYNDPFLILDVCIILVFAIGVLEKSRLASTGMFVYCGISWYVYFQGGMPQANMSFFLVLSVIYFVASLATFVNYKKQVAKNSRYKPGNKWLLISGIFIGIFVAFLALILVIDIE